MEEFRTMLRILAAVYARERKNGGVEYFDERIVKTDDKTRDRLLIKLQKKGYIDGLFVIDDIDGQTEAIIMWNASNPVVTFDGMNFLNSNETAKKVLKEIKDAAVTIAAQAIGSVIAGQIK